MKTGPTGDEMSQAETLPQLDASSLVDGERLEAEVKDMYRHVAREEDAAADEDSAGIIRHRRCGNLGHGWYDLQLRAEIQPRFPATSCEGRVPLHAGDGRTVEP